MKRDLLIITGLQCALIAGFAAWEASFVKAPVDRWSPTFQAAGPAVKQDVPKPPIPPAADDRDQPDPSFHPAEPPLSRLQGLPPQ